VKDNQSHFLAIYGRRRVGKTFLIRQYFDNKFDFYVTGLANGNTAAQLTNFYMALKQSAPHKHIDRPNNWMEAFHELKIILEQSTSGKKIIFIDELPWLDTPRSNFLMGLEFFWNSWASARNDVVLIGCGSAASWMLNKLINNKGGLYNRVTRRIKLSPFTLSEVEEFLFSKNYKVDRYQITQLYMVLGGIPFYLDLIDKDYSVAQNIQRIFFEKNALLSDEYDILFQSLFGSSEIHQQIIKALTAKRTGLTRKEILKNLDVKDGGGVTRAISELISSDFISQYQKFGNKSRDAIFQLTDPFTLFYHRFLSYYTGESNFWINQVNTPAMYTWQGNAFEIICLLHVEEIKKALGISGVQTTTSTWWGEGAQIDLVIDRKDQVINLVEIKFALDEYEIDKTYDEKLRKKLNAFRNETNTKKSLWTTMLTTYGIKSNKYSGNVHRSLTMDDLFN
jgi:AAA+ ATPase superfamily predicted ATPase